MEEQRDFPTVSEDKLPSLSIVVPTHFVNDYENRTAAWEWLRWRYRVFFPDAEIIEVDAAPDQEFNKPSLVNAGVQRAKGQVVLVSDADVVLPADALRSAVAHALTAPWVVPHGHVLRLRPEVSHKLYTEPPATPVLPSGPVIRPPYIGIPGGGIFAVRRSRFLDMGGFDPEFRGWGGEDSAFGMTADSLLGTHLRYRHVPLIHLYHAPGERVLNQFYAANVARIDMYRNLVRNRDELANFRGIDPLPREEMQMTVPQREDDIFEWLLYLNYLGVRTSATMGANKLQLMALALNNRYRVADTLGLAASADA